MPIKYKIIPSDILTNLLLWPNLHKLINTAYELTRNDWPLPQSFCRLHPDLKQGVEKLLKNLEDNGVLCVALLTSSDSEDESEESGEGDYEGEPIACAAIMEFEGDINDVRKEVERGLSAIKEVPLPTPTHTDNASKLPAWEFNLVSTSRLQQGKGIAQNLIKVLEEYALKNAQGAKVHMITRTIEEISGPFWRKRGYKTVEDGWITLPKGFTHMEGYNGLPRNMVLWTGEKWLVGM